MMRMFSLRRMRRLAGALALVLPLASAPALAAEDGSLVTGLSASRIDISSNFSGSDVVVFGVAEGLATGAAPAAAPGIVVTVTGPAERVAVRRKEHVAVVWLNRASERFSGVPSFYAMASSAPLDRIADPASLEAAGIGPAGAGIAPERALSPEDLVYWRDALVAERSRIGMWTETPGGVEMLAPDFFRTTVRLPAHVTGGTYQVTVSLFSGGRRVSVNHMPLVVAKSGFEARVADLSRLNPILYGLAVVAMALGTGWIGGFVFRRD